jgi:hypothetical protein
MERLARKSNKLSGFGYFYDFVNGAVGMLDTDTLPLILIQT